jgi:hypothetical protein
MIIVTINPALKYHSTALRRTTIDDLRLTIQERCKATAAGHRIRVRRINTVDPMRSETKQAIHPFTQTTVSPPLALAMTPFLSQQHHFHLPLISHS